MAVQLALARLTDEMERGLDLIQGPHVESGQEPAPTLDRQGGPREPQRIPEVTLAQEDEDLHASLQWAHIREDATVPQAVQPDPVVAHLLVGLVIMRVA
jgi:hypothetical protein